MVIYFVLDFLFLRDIKTCKYSYFFLVIRFLERFILHRRNVAPTVLVDVGWCVLEVRLPEVSAASVAIDYMVNLPGCTGTVVNIFGTGLAGPLQGVGMAEQVVDGCVEVGRVFHFKATSVGQ